MKWSCGIYHISGKLWWNFILWGLPGTAFKIYTIYMNIHVYMSNKCLSELGYFRESLFECIHIIQLRPVFDGYEYFLHI